MSRKWEVASKCQENSVANAEQSITEQENSVVSAEVLYQILQ